MTLASNENGKKIRQTETEMLVHVSVLDNGCKAMTLTPQTAQDKREHYVCRLEHSRWALGKPVFPEAAASTKSQVLDATCTKQQGSVDFHLYNSNCGKKLPS